MNTDALKDLLNQHLLTHPEYESWMMFDFVEFKPGIGLIPRYKSPKAAGVKMTEMKAREIYGKVCLDIIKPTSGL